MRLTVSVSTILPTSTTSAFQSPAFLVGQIFVPQNATTCLSLRKEHSSADGVSTLQPPPSPSGTRFHHSSAHHALVVDSLELGWKPISSHRPTDTSENFCWRAYYFTFTFTGNCYSYSGNGCGIIPLNSPGGSLHRARGEACSTWLHLHLCLRW